MTIEKKNFKPKLVSATAKELPVFNRMWLFYVYDMGHECGLNAGWECPVSLSFEPDDLTPYFADPTKRAYLIKIEDDLAGFVLLNQVDTSTETIWNMSEFFILSKFQGKGIGRQVAHQLWEMYPGRWKLSVIPENKRALAFWRKIVSVLTSNAYHEEIKNIGYGKSPERRYVFLSFDTHTRDNKDPRGETIGV